MLRGSLALELLLCLPCIFLAVGTELQWCSVTIKLVEKDVVQL